MFLNKAERIKYIDAWGRVWGEGVLNFNNFPKYYSPFCSIGGG
jgi:hypothetical protein